MSQTSLHLQNKRIWAEMIWTFSVMQMFCFESNPHLTFSTKALKADSQTTVMGWSSHLQETSLR